MQLIELFSRVHEQQLLDISDRQTPACTQASEVILNAGMPEVVCLGPLDLQAPSSEVASQAPAVSQRRSTRVPSLAARSERCLGALLAAVEPAEEC